MGSNSLAIVLMVLRWRVRILSLARVACSKEPDMQTFARRRQGQCMGNPCHRVARCLRRGELVHMTAGSGRLTTEHFSVCPSNQLLENRT